MGELEQRQGAYVHSMTADEKEMAAWKESVSERCVACDQNVTFFNELTWDNIYVVENGTMRAIDPENLTLSPDAQIVIRGEMIDQETNEAYQTDLELQEPVGLIEINGQVVVEGLDWVVSGVDFQAELEKARDEYEIELSKIDGPDVIDPFDDQYISDEDMTLDFDEPDAGTIPSVFDSHIDYHDCYMDPGEGPAFDNFGNANDGFDYHGDREL